MFRFTHVINNEFWVRLPPNMTTSYYFCHYLRDLFIVYEWCLQDNIALILGRPKPRRLIRN